MDYKLFASFTLAACSFAAAYGQEPADTVKVIDKAKNVVVVKTGDTTVVKADYLDEDGESLQFQYEVKVSKPDSVPVDDEFPDEWGMDLPFMRTRCVSCEDNKSGRHRVYRDITGMRHIYWGWRFNYNDKGNVKNSFEVGVRDLIGVSWKYRGAELEIGAGFGLKRFLADDGFVYEKNGDGVGLIPAPEGLDIKHSRLDVFAFHLPVLYNQRIVRGLSFTLGGILNFNSYAKAYTKAFDGTNQYKIDYKGLQQNLVTADAYAAINVCGFCLYSTWSPMNLFKKEYGPELKGWSLGVELSF
jgi:hypothetical protein